MQRAAGSRPEPVLLPWRFLCDLCASVSSVLKKRSPHAPALFDTEDTEAQRTQSQCSRRQGALYARIEPFTALDI